MRKGLFLVALALALWSAPGALAAGWCGGSTEAAADRPDVVTGQQVRAVVAIPSDGVGAHELIHALGALPDGDRAHPCPGDAGHPCDSTSDILYPYASGGPLSSLILDVNHDDYYAHPDSDPWVDIQDSRWLHRLDL